MRLIIAGSRSITDRSTIETALEESPFNLEDVNVLVNGDADGVDSIAVDIVTEARDEYESINITIDSYPADDFVDEAPHPKVAPLLRNTEMAENADALLAVWDGESNGTEDMISKAEKENLMIDIYRTDNTTLEEFF